MLHVLTEMLVYLYSAQECTESLSKQVHAALAVRIWASALNDNVKQNFSTETCQTHVKSLLFD